MFTVPMAALAALIWKPLALALAAALASLVFRSPAIRHAIWAAVLACMLALPAVMLFSPPLPLFPAPAPIVLTNPLIPLGSPAPGVSMSMRIVPPGTAPQPPERAWPAAIPAILYCAIAAALLARLVLAVRCTRELVSRSEPITLYEAEPIAAALSLAWPLPELRESAGVSTPSVTGHSRPVVLLPPDWREWPEAKLRAVLAHELAHARRADWAIALAAEINRCLFWLHPLAWWLPRQLSSLAEQACDELAVSITGDAPSYAEALLAAASSYQPRQAAGIAMASSSNVGHRIERVLSLRAFTATPLTSLRWATIAVCTVPLLVATASLRLSAQQSAIAIPDPLMESPAPTSEQVAVLERQLVARPDDQATRLKLATYYFLNAMHAERVRHIFWFIENHPESSLHSHNSLWLHPYVNPLNDPADYERAGALWRRQAGLHPSNASVLLNAAGFHASKDRFAAEDLLKRALRIDPEHRGTFDQLTLLYSRSISSGLVPTNISIGGAQTDPAFAKHAREFVESTPNAAIPGRVGLILAQSFNVPPGEDVPEHLKEYRRRLAEYGERLLRRARDLDPENLEWRSLPAPVPIPSFQSATPPEQFPVVASNVTPVYPPLAQQARIQGVVRMKAAIGSDGLPTNLTLVGGHPLLVPSALEAARLSRHPEHAGRTVIVEAPFRLP